MTSLHESDLEHDDDAGLVDDRQLTLLALLHVRSALGDVAQPLVHEIARQLVDANALPHTLSPLTGRPQRVSLTRLLLTPAAQDSLTSLLARQSASRKLASTRPVPGALSRRPLAPHLVGPSLAVRASASNVRAAFRALSPTSALALRRIAVTAGHVAPPYCVTFNHASTLCFTGADDANVKAQQACIIVVLSSLRLASPRLCAGVAHH
jgi:hypothetical protein